jgi:transcriptional regulator with XRE-family HTH domain
MIEIGIRLREERRRLNILLKDLAQLGDVRPNAQSAYENGSRFPRADYLAAIATVGIDILYVISGKRTSFSLEHLKADEFELIGSFRAMHKGDQQVFKRVAAALSNSSSSSTPLSGTGPEK